MSNTALEDQPVEKNKNVHNHEVHLDINTEDAVEIAEDVYWVGFYNEDEALHCNPYLISDNIDSILIDPGSIPDFPVVARKVFSIVPPQWVSTIVLGHQDPDLCAAVPIFEDMRDNHDHSVVSHTKTIYLLKHYGIKGKFYRIEDGITDYKTPGGRDLRFVSVPFSHFAGAIMTYDKKSNVLFTGDVLGGVGPDWELYHSDKSLENMKAFLQGFMPSNRALRYSLLKVLEVDAEIIAPQHGSIIRKKQLPALLDKIWDLPCGLDLIDDDTMKNTVANTWRHS